jgi:hypothetical protein
MEKYGICMSTDMFICYNVFIFRLEGAVVSQFWYNGHEDVKFFKETFRGCNLSFVNVVSS